MVVGRDRRPCSCISAVKLPFTVVLLIYRMKRRIKASSACSAKQGTHRSENVGQQCYIFCRGGSRKLFWEGHIGLESPKASSGKGLGRGLPLLHPTRWFGERRRGAVKI